MRWGPPGPTVVCMEREEGVKLVNTQPVFVDMNSSGSGEGSLLGLGSSLGLIETCAVRL